MKISFYKYEGTGNDFIVIDNRKKLFPLNNTKLIKYLCTRRIGIGADGLILLEHSDNYDFKMKYYNADGKESTMCGNGGRVIIAFARKKRIIKNQTTFIAIDGIHKGIYQQNGKKEFVKLKMKDIDKVFIRNNCYEINSGSPHYIEFRKDIKRINVYKNGKEIRNSSRYHKDGINVNFVEIVDKNTLKVRTYERGVEDETLSCGTGVTASMIASCILLKQEGRISKKIITKGGELFVSAYIKEQQATDVWLTGEVKKIFKGEICC